MGWRERRVKYTLLMRLAGPMQAWGLQSRFSIRDTAREPTKSGILGLLCAALGKPRAERPGDGFPTLADLAALCMGVRVDREGQVRRDFHTAMDVLIASSTQRQIERGQPKTKDTEPSHRYYLADAWFIVGLEGKDRTLLERLDAALARPRWPLFLGRKSMVPGWPVRLVSEEGKPKGPVDVPLLDALASVQDPLWPSSWSPPAERRRIIIDAAADVTQQVIARRMQPDHPRSLQSRSFLPRDVVTAYLDMNLKDDVPE